MWKYILILIVAVSCSKEQAVELKPLANSGDTVNLTLRIYPTTYPLVTRPVYGFELKSSHRLKQPTLFWTSFKDSSFNRQQIIPLLAEKSETKYPSTIEIEKAPTDVRLVKVDGDTTIKYKLKYLP